MDLRDAGARPEWGGEPVGPGRPQREKWSIKKKLLVFGCSALACVIVVAAVLFGLAWNHLDGNIRTQDANLRPSDMGGKQDILFIGSDSRAGGNQSLGGGDVQGARSDTTMVFDSPADRHEGTEVSIPRDSMVQVPACISTTGESQAPYYGMFNSAFAGGGAPCTVATVQNLTGLTLTHYIVVDFEGVVGVVNALGGVKVCVTQAVDDKDSGLKLPAGVSTLNGDQALAFVRARYALGNGSDLQRIQRQQYFLNQLEQQVRAAGLLTDPLKLYNVLDAATRSVTTDPGLGSVSDLYGLAQTLNAIPTGKINYVTVPNEPYPADPNRVVWTEPDATNLWDGLIDEKTTAGAAPAGALGDPGAPDELARGAQQALSAQELSLKRLEGVMKLALLADTPTDDGSGTGGANAGSNSPSAIGTCPVS